MSAAPAPFDRRIDQLRALMAERGADLCLADHGELMAWLTGYTVSETMYRSVLVPMSAKPWTVLRALDAPQAIAQGWVQDCVGFADHDDPYAAVAASIVEHGLGTARVLVDSASYSFTAHARSRLEQSLPAATWTYDPGFGDRLRACKDESEIANLRQAAAIADRTMTALAGRLGPGSTSRQAGALAAASYLELGADDGQVGRICRGGGATGFLHAELDDAPLGRGDVLHVELVPRVRRYSARLMRPIAIEEVPQDGLAVTRALVTHQDRQIAAMSAGAPACDVDAVLREGLLADGLRETYDNVTGYMLGLYGRTPRSSDFSHVFLPSSRWTLEAGMVFHMYTSAAGIGLSETVLVTERGGERLTRAPREMLVTQVG